MPTAAAVEPVLARLEELASRAPALTDVFFHRLGAVEAARRRDAGLALPDPLLAEERFAAIAAIAGQVVRGRIREAYDGRMLILKGAEVARRYPDPALRPSHDLDLLVDDPAAAQQALLAAGCEVGWHRASSHHELPLVFPDLPLVIEVHRAPKWPAGIAPPPAAELLDAGEPVDGYLALPPAEHAVVVAAHAWAERPLGRVMDLADVQVLLGDADPGAAAGIAAAWGLDRIWAATLAAIDAVLDAGPSPAPLRTWARHTPAVREPTRPERIAARIAAPFWALPPREAARAATGSVVAAAHDLRAGHARGSRAAAEHPALNPLVVEDALRRDAAG
jgi:hypothetical protein